MSAFKDKYSKVVLPGLNKKYNYSNPNITPKIEKIVINCCTKDAVSNAKVVDSIINDLGQITGQKPVSVKAKTSIASFKVREGMPLGACVTLRGEKMYEFLERLIMISLPRVRDFRGVPSKGFDGRGNYTMGLKEQIIFPEINYDKIDKVRGMSISIVTTASTNEEARDLLEMFGMPFRK
jgi:large subunit ribosomal protein L5